MIGVSEKTVVANPNVCRYCDGHGRLIKAHIIPAGFFRHLGENGGTNRILGMEDHPKKCPIGPYDTGILCHSCDQGFGPGDQYALDLLGRTLKNSSPIMANGEIIGWECADFNYALLKRFFISLLWRASISTNPFFESINLGPFATEAKELLKSANPSGSEAFAVFLEKFDEPLGEAVLQPQREKIDGINHFRFYLGGYVAHIKVDKRSCTRVSDLLLHPNKPLRVTKLNLLRSGEAKVIHEIIQAPKNQLPSHWGESYAFPNGVGSERNA